MCIVFSRQFRRKPHRAACTFSASLANLRETAVWAVRKHTGGESAARRAASLAGSDLLRSGVRIAKCFRVQVALMMLAAAGCLHVRDATEGVVVNSRDETPIPDVRVTAECLRTKLHGSRTLKTLETQTNEDGVYRFSAWDLALCDFMFVRGEKAGYAMTKTVDIRYGDSRYEDIPRRVYLTPVDALGIQALEYRFAMSRGTARHPNGTPYPEGQYQSVYSAFYCSSKLARTPDERLFVREHYCARLKALASALDEATRSGLGTLHTDPCEIQGARQPIAIDLQALDDYCARS